jgi:hypothetical protein
MIVNDQPYGSERPYNALRLADAVACAIAGQQLPDGHYGGRRGQPVFRRRRFARCSCVGVREVAFAHQAPGRAV